MVIIGCGLAGLSAAVALAEASVEVDVLERSDRPGGRVAAWRDDDGDTIEHGVHGWWHQYFNAFDLLQRAGVGDEAFIPHRFPSSMIDECGTRVELREPPVKYPTPFYLAYFLWGFKKLGCTDHVFAVPAMSRLFSFVHGSDMERYDTLSMYAYMDNLGMTSSFHEEVLSPFARSFGFSSTEELSAGAVMSALTFYLVNHQEDVNARWCLGNPQELIIEPIARHAEAHGCRFGLGTTVDGLALAPGGRRVSAAVVGGRAEQVRVPLSSLPEQAPALVEAGGGGRVWIRRVGDHVLALSATCTHQGCDVELSDGLYRCPCHGSAFDLSGEVLEGPAGLPLKALSATIVGDSVVIELSKEQGVVEGDFFVLATDVEATKRILASSPSMLKHQDVRRIFNLETTEVMVARLWLDKSVDADLTVGSFSGLGLLDNYFVLSNYQDEYLEYDGTVIEVQMYVVRDYIELPDEQLQPLVLGELGVRIPALLGAEVRKWSVQRIPDRFPHFNVSSEASRPGVRSSVENLYFAGDWLKVEEPWWMMERAVVTGKLAANEILRELGLAQTEIQFPRADEPFTKVMKGVTAAALRAEHVAQSVLRYRRMRSSFRS